MTSSETPVYRSITVRTKGDEVAHANYERILSLTGEVTLAWASLEEQLVSLVYFLSESTWSAAEIVYYSLSSFSGRLALINNLVQHEMPDGPEKALLERALDRIGRLSGARNAFVHSTVGITSGAVRTPYVTRTVWQPRREERKETYRTGPADMEAHLAKLGSLYQLLYFMTCHESDTRTVRQWARLAVNTA